MDAATPNRRWFYPTPGRLIAGLLLAECLLWLSDRLGWPAWHKGYAVLTGIAAVGAVLVVMLLWFAAALIFRWRFQFGIRFLLVLVAATAIPCDWLAVEMRNAKEQRECVMSIEREFRGCVQYDWEINLESSLTPGPEPDSYIALPPPENWRGIVPTGPLSGRQPGLDWLCSLFGIEFLADAVAATVDNPDFGDTELKRVAKLRLLKKLDLTNSRITDAGLVRLKDLYRMEILILDETQVTDEGIKSLDHLTNLKALSLYGTKVTEAGLQYVHGLKQLAYLDGVWVTDAGLEQLHALTRLKRLYLDSGVTDSGLSQLQGLKDLIRLDLNRADITDDGMKYVRGLTELQTLKISGPKISDVGLENVKGLAKLVGLDLASTRISDAGLANLEGLPRLKWLCLINTNVTDAGIQHLGRLRQLKELYLGAAKVSDAGVLRLRQQLPDCKIVH